MADFAIQPSNNDWADKKAMEIVSLVRAGKHMPIADLQRIVAHELRIAFYSGGADASRKLAEDLKPGAKVITLQETEH